MPMSAEECRAHADTCEGMAEAPRLSGRTMPVSATRCVRLLSNGVYLRRMQRFAPPLGRCPKVHLLHNSAILRYSGRNGTRIYLTKNGLPILTELRCSIRPGS